MKEEAKEWFRKANEKLTCISKGGHPKAKTIRDGNHFWIETSWVRCSDKDCPNCERKERIANGKPE